MAVFEVLRHGPITEFVMVPTIAGRRMLPFHAYLVDGLLIDTGPPHVAGHVAALLREFAIDQVVNTHHHEDHAGNNALIARVLDVPIYAHALALGPLATPARLPFYQRLAWGQPAPSIARPLPDVLRTPRYAFEPVHTPGHATDHVALLERTEGWLFTGDLFIAEKLKVLRRDEDVRLLSRSIGVAAALPHGTVFCAHRGVVADGPAALGRKHAYLEELGLRVDELHARGLGEGAIARRLLGREDAMAFVSAGDFTRQNVVTSWVRGPQPRPSGRAGS